LFCDNCGRELPPDGRFCDCCGRKVIEEHPPTSSSIPTPTAPDVFLIPPPRAEAIPAPQETPGAGHQLVGEAVGSKLRDSAPSPPTAKRGRTIFPWHPRFSRRSLVISAVGLAVTIIVVSLVATSILSPGILILPQGTASSTTAVTTTSGGVLSVQINIANSPTTLGAIQTIIVTVLDQGGKPVPEATVHLEVTSPSGYTTVLEASTDASGLHTFVLQIQALPSSVGTFQVKASATKAGYQTGQAEATFQVTETVP